MSDNDFSGDSDPGVQWWKMIQLCCLLAFAGVWSVATLIYMERVNREAIEIQQRIDAKRKQP